MKPQESLLSFRSPEARKKVVELSSFVESMSQEIRERDGIPLDTSGRIEMAAYASTYQDTQDDTRRARELEIEWLGEGSREEQLARRLESDGERLELLTHALFVKNLGQDFLVMRSSLHDDRVNGVDTLIFEKATGNIISAFDEVGASSGPEYDSKKQRVFHKNANERGARLKYGLHLNAKTGVIELGSVENIPLFYFALPKDKIWKGVAEFTPSKEQSEFERALFKYFVMAIDLQMKDLRLFTARLDNTLKRRLDVFDRTVHKTLR